MTDDQASLVDALIAFIDTPPRDADAIDAAFDSAFDSLAARVFAHQYAHDEIYRRFCQRRGIAPRRVRGWRDVPAVPIAAFKETTLSAAPIDACERVFMTSGTTRADSRGRHYHPTLAVYDRSMTRNFAARFMRERERLPMAMLFPDEATLPNSSLAHYLSLAVSQFGSGGSRHFVDATGIDIDAFRSWVDAMRAAGKPCAVLGASYSFVHVLDALSPDADRLRLPDGSLLLDTGGYKRQSRELALDDFYDALSTAFAVPRSRCINMYGMTELSTQFYDNGNAVVPSVKSGPHWIRSRAIDPVTGRDVAAGESGVLVHCDLANFNSTVAILTEDRGRMVDGGFELLGRVDGAEAKGCSLAVEAFVEASQGVQ